MIDLLHRVVPLLAAAVVVAGISWSVILALLGKDGGPTYVRFQAAVVAVLIAAAASGLLLLALGRSPTEGLHFLYTAIAIAAIPLARSFMGRRQGRQQALVLLLAFLVLGALVFRLFASG